jgi:hypothetical protein
VTADRYSNALIDYREVDRPRLLEHVRGALPSVLPSGAEGAPFAGAF